MSKELDLYDYPSDHTGRRSYVSVVGHARSIPKFKTYKGGDGHYHIHPAYGGTWDGLGNSSAFIMPDKAGYVSPMDGKFIEGRAAHRDHMKRHDVIEVGDQPIGMERQERAPMGSVHHDIIETLRQKGY